MKAMLVTFIKTSKATNIVTKVLIFTVKNQAYHKLVHMIQKIVFMKRRLSKPNFEFKFRKKN